MKYRMLLALALLLALLVPTAQAQEADFLLGEVITIEGEVQEILSANSFLMARTEPFDFTPSEVIVFNDDLEPFAIDVNVGRTVQVTGTLNALVYDQFAGDLGYDVDTAVYTDFDATDYAVVADLVTDPGMLPEAGDYAYDPDLAAEVQENPAAFVGETFTAEGYVGEILDPYTFTLEDTTPFQFTPGEFIVVNDDTLPFEVDVNVGRRVRVTGELRAYDYLDINALTDYELDPETFEFYDTGDFVLVAEAVTQVRAYTPAQLDAVTSASSDVVTTDATMDEVEDDPLAYLGMTLSLEGEIEDIYSPNSFLLEEDEFFDLDPMQIPVFAEEPVNYPPGGTDPLAFDDELYLVTGEIVAFDLFDIEAELGFDFDDESYLGFDADDIAIIATQVVLIEP